MNNKVQYWQNGKYVCLVTKDESKAIIEDAKNRGFKVFDFDYHFSIWDKDFKRE